MNDAQLLLVTIGHVIFYQALKLLDVLVERGISDDADRVMREVLPLMQASEPSVWKALRFSVLTCTSQLCMQLESKAGARAAFCLPLLLP